MKETLYDIACSISKHRDKEIKMSATNLAFGRLLCSVKSSNPQNKNIKNGKFWLTNNENTAGVVQVCGFGGDKYAAGTNIKTTLTTDGQVIYKNTRLGRILCSNYKGTHAYITKTKCPKREYENSVEIFNKAIYYVSVSGIKDISLRLSEDEREFTFRTLKSLLDLQSKEQEALEEARRKQEELLEKQKIAKEAAEKAAEKAAEEEAKRLLAEQIEAERKAEEEAKMIKMLEDKIRDSQLKIDIAQSFIREEFNLRSQHALDDFQENAKRSHLFDGIPILINGGPGTGKTTTMIQRLRFLTSRIALEEHDVFLTENQLSNLTDSDKIGNNWILFSPTMNLLQFLKKNMAEEGLKVNDSNTAIVSDFRDALFMQSYHLNNPDTNSPFCDCKKKYKQNALILRPTAAIQRFESYLVDNVMQVIHTAAELKTSNYSWHKLALRIKAYCSKSSDINSIDDLVLLFNSLQDSAELEEIKRIDNELKSILSRTVLKLQVKITEDEDKNKLLIQWFEKCKKDRRRNSEDNEEDIEIEEEEVSFVSQKDFEPYLNDKLKSLLVNLSLMEVDPKQKLSKSNVDLLNIIKDDIDEIVDLKAIGERKWFLKKYALLCKGFEINILSKIPAVYKKFRKAILNEKSDLYDVNLLAEISKNDNKHLHPDEQNLLIGFINEIIISVSKKYKQRFNEMKHPYALAYKENCKYIIAVDEVTDYSLLDLYFINSLRHYDFSSLTLCGDIMQGLNLYGIGDWQTLKNSLLPKLSIYDLQISYRQLPTLLEVARNMYLDDIGEEPKYHSLKKKADLEPLPLAFVSEDREDSLDWIAERVADVYTAYNKKMPSVAIFVNDEENIDSFVEDLNESDYIGQVKATNCSGNSVQIDRPQVRVFKLSEVKGMEFEVVFFYNIDQAVGQSKSRLIRRYLYVGLSRATAYMAATFTKEEGNEDILKYFVFDDENWKL